MVSVTKTKTTKPILKKQNVLLSVEDLHVWFELKRFGFGHAGWVKAVDGVNFTLNKGETIAVVGESGSGKSSLMKTVLGLYKPTKGKVIFDGLDLSKLGAAEMRAYFSSVGYIQQDPYAALPPFMTVRRILAEPLIISGVRSQRVREQRIRKAMEEVKLGPVEIFLEKYPHMLSGGEQQRVSIARAMINEPKLLVADEPVSMLDASVRVEILKLIRSIQESHGLSLIYVTHDLSTVRYFSERVFVMYAGNIIESALVENMLGNPLHPYAQALLTATSEPDAKNAETYKDVPPGEPPSLVHPPSGCRFHPRCPEFMKGICEIEFPPAFSPEREHLVNCYLYDPQLEAKKKALKKK